MTRGSVVLVALLAVVALCHANAIPSPSNTTQGGCEKISSNQPDTGETQEVLYNDIVRGAYPHAVKVTKDLNSAGDGSLVTSVALRLAREGNMNLLSYAYVLWSGDEKNILNQYIPDPIKRIFNGSVTLKHRKYGLALKLGRWISPNGLRIPWGDGFNNQPITIKNWNLIPLWNNNQVYFLIQNVDRNMYLKMVDGEDTRWDNVGDRRVYSSDSTELPSHAWYLEPVVIGDDICFYIINAQFNQGLKLQQTTYTDNDRLSWGHNGNIRSDPLHFAWSILSPSVGAE